MEWTEKEIIAKLNDCIKNEKYDELFEYSKMGMILYPKSVDILFSMAFYFFMKEQFSEARNYSEQVLAIDPNKAGPYFILGTISHKNGLINEAITLLEKALSYDPSLFTNAIYLQLTKCYFEKNDIEKGLEYHVKLLDTENRISNIKSILEYFIRNGLDQYLMTLYNNRLNSNDNDLIAMERLAILFYLKNEFDQSNSLFNKILRFDNDNQIANYYLGRISQNGGKYEEAYKYYNTLTGNEPKDFFLDRTRYLLGSENLHNILQDYLISALTKYGEVPEEYVMMLLFDIVQCSKILRNEIKKLYDTYFCKLIDEQKMNTNYKKTIIERSWEYKQLFVILMAPKLQKIYLLLSNHDKNMRAYYQSKIVGIDIVLLQNLLNFYEGFPRETIFKLKFIQNDINLLDKDPCKYKEDHLYEALDKFQKTLQIRPINREVYKYIVQSMAEIYRELNKTEETNQFYKKALESIEEKQSLEYLYINRDFAVFNKDISLLTKITEIAVGKNLYYFASETLYELAIIDKNNQIEYLIKAVEMFDKLFDNLKDEKFKYGFLDSKVYIYKTLINKLLEQNRIKDAYYYLEKSKSKYFIEMMKKIRNNIIEEEEDIEWSYRGDYFKRVYEKQEKFNQKFNEPIDNSILFEIMPVIDAVNPVIFIQYYIYNSNTIAILVFYKQPMININVCIYTAIPEYFINKNDKKTNIYDDKNLEDLYEKLFKPVIEMLTIGIYPLPTLKNIHFIIIPDMYLHNVPFVALKNPKTKKYLIEEEFVISTIPSLTTMLILLDRPRKPDISTIFGIDLIGYLNTYNKIGISDILDSLNLPRVVIEEENDKLKLKMKLLDSTKETSIDWEWNNINDVLSINRNLTAYIFTGHGIYCQDIFQSYIDYNKSKDNQNDKWRLYLKDIYEYNFNFSIVILLACFTGIVDSAITLGDEINGLLRGFYLANARAIIGTLWETESFANNEFIKNFLINFKKSDYIDVALKEAMLRLMAINPDPSFWGAYFLSGDPRKL